jgi:hypothetical protein
MKYLYYLPKYKKKVYNVYKGYGDYLIYGNKKGLGQKPIKPPNGNIRQFE